MKENQVMIWITTDQSELKRRQNGRNGSQGSPKDKYAMVQSIHTAFGEEGNFLTYLPEFSKVLMDTQESERLFG